MENTENQHEEEDALFKSSLTLINKAKNIIMSSEKYIETINKLELVNEERFKEIVIFIMKLKLNNTVNNWEKKEPLEDLSILGAVYTKNFFKECIYPIEVLGDIKFLLENVYLITKYLHSSDSILPSPYLECSDVLNEQFKVEVNMIKNMNSLKNKEEFVILKEKIYPVFVKYIGSHLLSVYNILPEENDKQPDSEEPFN